MAFLTVLILCAVHLAAGTAVAGHRAWTPRMLSLASGISVSYVFLDLLPDLSRRQATIEALALLTLLDRHVYILALVGLVVAFWVETASRESRRQRRRSGGPDETGRAAYRLSMGSFIVQNLAIGYAVGSPGDPAVEHHGDRYRSQGRWWLAGALPAGWAAGSAPSISLPSLVLAMVLSYVAGGTILNILRHELPDTDRSADVGALVLGAAGYTALLLMLP